MKAPNVTPGEWILSQKMGRPPKITTMPPQPGFVAQIGIPHEGCRMANGQLLAASKEMAKALEYSLHVLKDAIDRGLCPPLLMTDNGGRGLAPIQDALLAAGYTE